MLTLLLSAATLTAHAGAWTQPRGESYGKLNTRVIAGSQAFDQDGTLRPTDTFNDVSLQGYYEVGISDHLTAVYTGTPLGRATYGGASSQYLGPNAVGLRRSLWEADLRVAVEGRVGWSEPFGAVDLASESESGLTPDGFVYTPAVTNHWVDLEISAGRGIKSGWVTGTIGGRSNTGEGMGNAVLGSVQGGWVFKQKFVVDAHVPFYLPTTPVEQVNIAGVGHTRYIGFGLGFGWWFKDRIGLAVGVDTAPIAASNAGSPSLTLGLQFR